MIENDEIEETVEQSVERTIGYTDDTSVNPITDYWVKLVVLQGGRCRNCENKATLTFVGYDKVTGEKTITSEEDLEIYKLCHPCADKIINAKEIMTYGWSYDKLKARDRILDRDFQKKVYGGG